MLFPKVYFTFWRTLLSYLFGINKGAPFYYLSKNLYSTSFRIGEKDRGKFLLAWSFPLGQILRAKIIPKTKGDAKEKTCVYDNSNAVIAKRIQYLEYFTKRKPDAELFKQDLLYFQTAFGKIMYLLIAIPFIFFLFLISIFKKDKAPFALITVELIENYNLLRQCRTQNIKEIFFFSIYQKDSNLSAHLLMKHGIKVNKITSEVPIAIWNSIMLADKLCVCQAYQLEEVKHFSNSIFVTETELWGPEQMMDVYHLYKDGKRGTDPNTIGFYSTAAWVRKLEGHLDQGFDMERSEEELKSQLGSYLKAHTELSLIIYLHPKERSEKYFAIAQARYTKSFEGVRVSFAPTGIRSSEQFKKTDVAVAFVTTLMYERIYFGFKSIFMPIGIKGFPLKGSGIESICVYNKDELFKKLDQALALSTPDFFKQNNLENYVFTPR